MKFQPFRDRDYIQDKQGGIYQVIGSIHPQNKVIALQKYQRISPKDDPEIHKRLIPVNDPISKVRNHDLMYWKQKTTAEEFIRVLPNYSSKSAEANIKSHSFKNFNSVFQMELIEVPYEQILHHWHPQQRFKDLLLIIEKGSLQEKQNLDRLERETVEVGLNLNELFGIDLDHIGVTGSILWESHHNKSDIDIMIYGIGATKKIVEASLNISSHKRGLRRYKTTEILPLAEKMALKTGRDMEECFEYIYRKNYLFFFNQRKVSITFAPTFSELIHYPFYYSDTIFSSLTPIRIKAKIKNNRWGYYYPSLFEIECIEIMEKKFEIYREEITRLMVYEHELVGHFRTGDFVEIRGLLQKATNVPSFKEIGAIDTFQIFLGGQETFGNEYIHLITIEEDLNGEI
ncbi:hypothetical protein NEF87_003372 [Candidatus Lokiarchaeum ossiferum]|uniref:Polymerase nucleotidyl transferase domain-containing protein n=1 Tax=Candidatus Lokiarchaeum ossiferum TaxID=2951803 RepID=A0ABY6HU85_9ARCH|nr:hypothetical protein NEF87_003372 [Candidatus Lokiarchaeum sp. B-35]